MNKSKMQSGGNAQLPNNIQNLTSMDFQRGFESFEKSNSL